MPVRRKKRSKHIARKNRGSKKTIYKIVAILASLIFLSMVFISSKTRYWTKDDRLLVATTNSQNDAVVVVLDPVSSEIDLLSIPSNTEVNVSSNLGKWKIGSVWKLSENEKIPGELLSKTLAYHFGIPVYVWADDNFVGLITPGFFARFKSLFTLRETNLSFSDKLRIMFFSMRVKEINLSELDLRNTSYLQKTDLPDGEPGYMTRGDLPPFISSYFYSYYFKERGKRVLVHDRTNEFGVSDKVSKVIVTTGANVAAVLREDGEDLICEVKTRDHLLETILTNVFPCKEVDGEPEGNYDAEIILGEGFQKNF